MAASCGHPQNRRGEVVIKEPTARLIRLTPHSFLIGRIMTRLAPVCIQDDCGQIKTVHFDDPRTEFIRWYNEAHPNESAYVVEGNQPDARTTSSAIVTKRDA